MTSQREAATMRAAQGDGSPRLHLVDYATVRRLLTPLMLAPDEAQLRRWSAKGKFPPHIKVGHSPAWWDLHQVRTWIDDILHPLAKHGDMVG